MNLSRSSDDLSNNYEWESFSAYEKKRYSNLISNFKVLKSIGITPTLPKFFQASKSYPDKNSSGDAKSQANKSLLNTKFKPFAVPKIQKRKKNKYLTNSIPNIITDFSLEYKKKLVSDKEEFTKKIHPKEVNVKDIVKILLKKAESQFQVFEAYIAKNNCLDIDTKNESVAKRRYPKRSSIKTKSYKEEDISSDDEFLYCDDCEHDYKGPCPIHGPMIWVCDTKVPKKTPDRALKTIPEFLSIGKSRFPKAGLGVWTEIPLAKGVVFGPYKGNITKNRKEAQKSGYAWMVWKGGKADHFVEGEQTDTSSWMRFVNCADREETQNLVAFQYKKQIYYKTYKQVLPFQELLVWYGAEYAADLEMDLSKKADIQITNVEGFACDVCQSLFSSLEMMARHAQRHPNTRLSLRHACPQCDYSTNSSSSLRRHLSVHNGEKRHRCPECHKQFALKSKLRIHERTHTGDRPFHCGVCGDTFNQKDHLRRHERTHSGVRPYLCSVCGKDFIDSSNLNRHKRTHTQQRPYRCKHCEYRYSDRTPLKRHVIHKHTKEFPHACSHCSRGFILPSLLRKHLEKMHS